MAGGSLKMRLPVELSVRDLKAFIRYGANAPRRCERIWIDPAQCMTVVESFSRASSGQIIGGDWDTGNNLVSDMPKIRMARLHWQDGLSWEDTGVYEYMMRRITSGGPLDGCSTLDDVKARYDKLDALFETVRREGRLRTREELGRRRREKGGVYVHIGRNNRPVFGAGGCHRLAIAQIIGLKSIPAQLGVVHPESLRTWRRLTARAAPLGHHSGRPC
jgi:hypothetical protein